MSILKFFKNRKLFLLNVFLVSYVAINLIGGERGLVSYIEKKKLQSKLILEETILTKKFINLEIKNNLLSEKKDLDYLDILYRDRLKVGKKDEILIRLT